MTTTPARRRRSTPGNTGTSETSSVPNPSPAKPAAGATPVSGDPDYLEVDADVRAIRDAINAAYR